LHTFEVQQVARLPEEFIRPNHAINMVVMADGCRGNKKPLGFTERLGNRGRSATPDRY
jgi:hypothetical protein